MSDPAAIDLGRRFRLGDEAAVREVHARYAGPVTTVARSIVGHPDLVSEVVQQTFVKAWRGAASFEADRDLAPWLYSIARRTAIDVLRRERKGDVILTEVTGEEPAPTGETFERTWERWQIRQAIDDLPDGEREVVKLVRMAGLTHTEAAERLGVPVGTIKSRSAKAHRRLAAALRHLQADPGESANRIPSEHVEDGEGR